MIPNTYDFFRTDYLESLKRSWETYKSGAFLDDPNFKKFIDTVEIGMPESKTKAEEALFSFPDLFAYSVRRMVTHREDTLYKNLKHIFDRSGYRGICDDPRLFNKETVPPGIVIQHVTAIELNRLSQLTKREWHEELSQTKQLLKDGNSVRE